MEPGLAAAIPATASQFPSGLQASVRTRCSAGPRRFTTGSPPASVWIRTVPAGEMEACRPPSRSVASKSRPGISEGPEIIRGAAKGLWTPHRNHSRSVHARSANPSSLQRKFRVDRLKTGGHPSRRQGMGSEACWLAAWTTQASHSSRKSGPDRMRRAASMLVRAIQYHPCTPCSRACLASPSRSNRRDSASRAFMVWSLAPFWSVPKARKRMRTTSAQ
jgi:hypothetical protein